MDRMRTTQRLLDEIIYLAAPLSNLSDMKDNPINNLTRKDIAVLFEARNLLKGMHTELDCVISPVF